MKAMKPPGLVLFATGLLFAIAGAAKLPAGDARFPDTWPLALGGILAGTLGVALWHLALRAERQAARAASDASGETASAISLLEALIEPARALVADAPALRAEEIEARTDALLTTYVLPFAEVRQQLIDRFGMARGADLLVTVAYGERLLNRVWSAAADGHLEEARACLPEAVDAFIEAQGRL